MPWASQVPVPVLVLVPVCVCVRESVPALRRTPFLAWALIPERLRVRSRGAWPSQATPIPLRICLLLLDIIVSTIVLLLLVSVLLALIPGTSFGTKYCKHTHTTSSTTHLSYSTSTQRGKPSRRPLLWLQRDASTITSKIPAMCTSTSPSPTQDALGINVILRLCPYVYVCMCSWLHVCLCVCWYMFFFCDSSHVHMYKCMNLWIQLCLYMCATMVVVE